MRNLLYATIAFLIITNAHAARTTEDDWPEQDIIKFLGKPSKVIHQQESGCNETFYQYDQGGPYVQVEFRCTHFNVAWYLFKEPKFKAADEKAYALAEKAIYRMTRTRPDEMMQITSGAKLYHADVNEEFTVNGSCGTWQCLLTYYPNPKP